MGTENKRWSMQQHENFTKKLRKNMVADYKHWAVILNIQQYYVGRTLVWAKRYEAHSEFDLTDEEIEEVLRIKRDVKAALDATLKPDMINTAFLGNEVDHCHCHIIPRYHQVRKVLAGGDVFQDQFFGKHWYQDSAKYFKTRQRPFEGVKAILTTAIANVRKQRKRPLTTPKFTSAAIEVVRNDAQALVQVIDLKSVKETKEDTQKPKHCPTQELIGITIIRKYAHPYQYKHKGIVRILLTNIRLFDSHSNTSAVDLSIYVSISIMSLF
uniref:HIT domain-containing protein n=1 Tax=Lotharella globosa TaxID=91324 RepID=A0A7S3YPD6_9EUKA